MSAAIMIKKYLNTYSILKQVILSFLIAGTTLLAAEKTHPLVDAAKNQVGKTVHYNPAYQKMAYPLGDVSMKEGVCTDVIIRAFRKLGLDLQKLVHEDIKKSPKIYSKKWKWGFRGIDSNIDHRRVPNLMTYFDRQKMAVTDGHFRSGDIVVWDLGRGILHIGILSCKMVTSEQGQEHPLVFHNISCGVQEEDILKSYKIIAHYRLKVGKGSK